MEYLRHCENATFLDTRLYYYVMNGGSVMNSFRSQRCVSEGYIGIPRAWVYSAAVVKPLSVELEIYTQSRAAMFYQTVLRKLEQPDEAFIEEAVSYVRQHKDTLRHYKWGIKYYLSALLLCASYPLWAKVFRRGLPEKV